MALSMGKIFEALGLFVSDDDIQVDERIRSRAFAKFMLLWAFCLT